MQILSFFLPPISFIQVSMSLVSKVWQEWTFLKPGGALYATLQQLVLKYSRICTETRACNFCIENHMTNVTTCTMLRHLLEAPSSRGRRSSSHSCSCRMYCSSSPARADIFSHRYFRSLGKDMYTCNHYN